MDMAIAEIYPQGSIEHDEGFVGVLVVVPNEIAFDLHDLELVVVHFGYHFRRPVLVEQAELLREIYRVVFHAGSPVVRSARVGLRAPELHMTLQDDTGFANVTPGACRSVAL